MTCALSPTGLIPWFSKLREILTLLCCITLSSSRENQRSAQEVARTGGGELFRGGEAALGPAVRPVVAGGSGGCRLKMNCRPSLNYMSSASLLPLRSVSTVAFRFHSKFQFRQLSSESTVFTSSVVVRWFLVMLILHPFYIIYWRCY